MKSLRKHLRMSKYGKVFTAGKGVGKVDPKNIESIRMLAHKQNVARLIKRAATAWNVPKGKRAAEVRKLMGAPRKMTVRRIMMWKQGR